MEGSSNAADRIIRFLVDNAHCAECGSRYHEEDVYVLDELDRRIWDLAAVCHSCYTLSVVRAVVRPQGGRNGGQVTEEVPVVEGADQVAEAARLNEMTTSEAHHFEALPPIDVDDVLDVCEFLEEFDGDFRGLFGREPEVP